MSCAHTGLPRWFSGKESAHQCKRRKGPLGQKDPPEEEMATHSSILAWRMPWPEEPWGHKESDTTEWAHARVLVEPLHFLFFFFIFIYFFLFVVDFVIHWSPCIFWAAYMLQGRMSHAHEWEPHSLSSTVLLLSLPFLEQGGQLRPSAPSLFFKSQRWTIFIGPFIPKYLRRKFLGLLRIFS